MRRNPDTGKDQWQFQMHTKAIQHTGADNLMFFTSGLLPAELEKLSVSGIYASEKHLQRELQSAADALAGNDCSIAVIPEGPYCAPIPADCAG